MNRDALTTDAPPRSLWAVCCHCGRWTRAAVELPSPGPVRYACPHCLLAVSAGSAAIHHTPLPPKR